MLNLSQNIRRFATLTMALTFVSAWHMSACQPTAAPPRDHAAWPAALIEDLMDAPKGEVMPRLQERTPDAHLLPGSLHRVRMTGDDWIDEIIVFFNLRSDRVDSVVLKYRAALDATSRAEALTQAGLLTRTSEIERGEVVTTPWGDRRALTLRARGADKQGRLTLTVEATKVTSPPK